MSIREVTMYKVVCDAAGCKVETNDHSDYYAWSDVDGALADWDCADQQSTQEGKHFCDEHRVPTCCGCDSAVVVVNDDPPTNGDWYCYKCASEEGLLGAPETAVQS